MISIFQDLREGKHIYLSSETISYFLAEINIVLFTALRQYNSGNLILNDFSD